MKHLVLLTGTSLLSQFNFFNPLTHTIPQSSGVYKPLSKTDIDDILKHTRKLPIEHWLFDNEIRAIMSYKKWDMIHLIAKNKDFDINNLMLLKAVATKGIRPKRYKTQQIALYIVSKDRLSRCFNPFYDLSRPWSILFHDCLNHIGNKHLTKDSSLTIHSCTLNHDDEKDFRDAARTYGCNRIKSQGEIVAKIALSDVLYLR